MTHTFAQRIHAAICELDRVLTALGKADEALVGAVTPAGIANARRSLAAHRLEFIRVQRELREIDAELTPVRPPSRDDMKAALSGAQNFGTGAHHERKP